MSRGYALVFHRKLLSSGFDTKLFLFFVSKAGQQEA